MKKNRHLNTHTHTHKVTEYVLRAKQIEEMKLMDEALKELTHMGR